MSIFRQIARFGGDLLLQRFAGRRGGGLPPPVLPGAGVQPTFGFPQLPAVLTRPGTGPEFMRHVLNLPQPSRGSGRTRSMDRPRRRRRRINPSNSKALARALRRVNAWDRQRKRVDKALRKACPTPRRRRAPPPRRS